MEEDQEIIEVELNKEPEVRTLSEEFASFLESEKHVCEVILAQEVIQSQIVKKERSFFEATDKRPANLEKLYHALPTIKPKSEEPERAFSTVDLFVTQIRNRLKDESLDMLRYLCASRPTTRITENCV